MLRTNNYPSFQFPVVILRDSPFSHFDGYALSCSPFVELVVNFLRHPTVPLWTTKSPNLPQKINTTIGIWVNSLCVCVIAVHSVSTSPEGFAFVDHEGLNNRLTSTEQTTCRYNFRGDVIQRDGHVCVVTQEAEEDCDAAHLIPHSKGDEVRLVVSSFNYLMMLFSSTWQK